MKKKALVTRDQLFEFFRIHPSFDQLCAVQYVISKTGCCTQTDLDNIEYVYFTLLGI